MSAIGSNWKDLKTKISSFHSNPSNKTNGKRDLFKMNKKSDGLATSGAFLRENNLLNHSPLLPSNSLNSTSKAKYIALDCEMVGIGPDGKQSALARCCVVDFDGIVIYDKFVRPKSFVTDFRTKWSGVRKQDLRAGEAVTLSDCQAEIATLLKSKILVGHALKNDLDVLMLSHPRSMIRDTSRFPPYMRPHGRKGGKHKPRSLKDISKQFLGTTIQTGEHDPGEDARSAMFLYRMKMNEWEDSIRVEQQNKRAAFKKLSKSTPKHTVDSNSAASVIDTNLTGAKRLIDDSLQTEETDKNKKPRSGSHENKPLVTSMFTRLQDSKHCMSISEIDNNMSKVPKVSNSKASNKT